MYLDFIPKLFLHRLGYVRVTGQNNLSYTRKYNPLWLDAIWVANLAISTAAPLPKAHFRTMECWLGSHSDIYQNLNITSARGVSLTPSKHTVWSATE